MGARNETIGSGVRSLEPGGAAYPYGGKAPSRLRLRKARDPRREAGFMMAMLIVFMVILGLLLLKVQPYARAEVMRDREAELIYRGEAIARAIRLHQLRTGSYPVSLEQLTAVRPRIIRKLYKDPMTVDGEWRKIYAVQPGASGDTTGLPIVGVASKSDEDRTYRIYRGKTMYSDWIFSAVDTVMGLPSTPRPPASPAPTDGSKDAPNPVDTTGGRR